MAYTDLDSALSDLFSGGPSTPTSVGKTAPADTGFATSDNPIASPSDSAAQLKSDLGSADAASRDSSDFLSQVVANTKTRASQLVANTTAASNARDSVTSNMMDETQNYSDTIKPILQKAAALSDHQAALAQMNPFQRAFAQLQHPFANDPDLLQQQQEALKNQANAHTTQFTSLMGIHKNTIDTINQHEQDQNDILQAGANSDQSIAAAQSALVGSLDHTVKEGLDQVTTNNAIVQSNAALREDTLGQMTLDQTNQALSLAQKNGGVATVNGIKLSQGQLQQKQDSWQEVNLNLSARKVALQASQVGLADELEKRALMHMSPSQIQAIQGNGGKDAQGNQYGMANLAQAGEAAKLQTQSQLDIATQDSSVGAYQSALRMIGTNVSNIRNKATDLFGVAPPELERQNQQLAVNLQSLQQGYKIAFDSGGPTAARAYIQQKLPELQGVVSDQQKSAEQMATQWAGVGHPNMAALGKGYLTGTALNPGTAASAIIEMSREGIPAGTRLSPDMVNTFNKVKGIVDSYYQKKDAQVAEGGKLLPGMKAPKNQIDPDLIKLVTGAMQQGSVQNNNTQLLNNLGVFAGKIPTPDGKPVPASRINPMDMQQSFAYGDQQGLHLAAQAAGVSDQAMKDIVGADANKSAQAYKAYADSKKGSAQPLDALKSGLLAQQTQQSLAHLRMTPSGQLGFDPALEVVKTWNMPEFQQLGMNFGQGKASQSAADYATHQVSGSAYGMSMMNYGNTLSQAFSTMEAKNTAQALDSQRKLRNAQPIDTATMALHSLEGFNTSDANQLMRAVVPAANNLVQTGQAKYVDPGDAIDQVITQGKFQDPQLEALRQRAAKDWMKTRAGTQKGLLGLLQSGDTFMHDALLNQTKMMTGSPAVSDQQ